MGHMHMCRIICLQCWIVVYEAVRRVKTAVLWCRVLGTGRRCGLMLPEL
jgi:hypothetical protein